MHFYNTFEILLWSIAGSGFLLSALLRSGQSRLQCFLAGVAFLLFAVSDWIELETGAWWRPWWLLVWKALCVIALAALYAWHVRVRRQKRLEADSISSERPSRPEQ